MSKDSLVRASKQSIERITRVPGGKAGNVAVAAARLLGPRQAAILGSLGSDAVASEQVRNFQEEGVSDFGTQVQSRDGIRSSIHLSLMNTERT